MDKSTLENYFGEFKNQIIGNDLTYHSPYGQQKMLYADWIASGRLYRPIEERLTNGVGPWVANTHTETSESGALITKAYQLAHKLIKEHVQAGPDDVIITAGSGMTQVINKLQRILGLRLCGEAGDNNCQLIQNRPVVFITHMEHHSNQTSWYESNVDVVVLDPDENLLVSTENLRKKLQEYPDRNLRIGAFTACSNVTGIETQVHELAKVMHENGGICFVDYAASAPYVDINMHPDDPLEKLDGIYFSPHKFLGGPGSSGVLIFDASLYSSKIPDNPGGGTVDWTNPWGEYKYIDDIELREDGGTPGFMQAIRAALAIELKNKMGTENIRLRESELLEIAFRELKTIAGLNILADNVHERLGVISFYIEDMHFNLVVKLLSDRFGVQVRGGCACAGTYGHYLLNVSHMDSNKITSLINQGDLSLKPGWVRLSLHPTMTNEELKFITNAIREIQARQEQWAADYIYERKTNEYFYREDSANKTEMIQGWFTL